MDRWRAASFTVPNISDIDDDELCRVLWDRDGRWSETVRSTVARLGGNGLDLNALWAGTPQGWGCSICLRSKAQIMRLSTTGVVIAHLHEHHDHLQDYMSATLRSRYGSGWPSVIPQGTYHLEQLGSELLARFEPTVVCADCNGADAFAKARLPQIDRRFSFRPSEIAKFINPAENAEHMIDVGVAEALWLSAMDEFQERLALANRLLDNIERGRITREAVAPGARRTYGTGDLVSWVWRSPDAAEALHTTNASIWARSLSRDAVGRSQEKSPRKPTPPTTEEVAAHDGAGAPELWAALAPDWRCPACARGRAQVMRRSNNPRRKWSGRVRPHREYVFEATPKGRAVVGHRNVIVCEDCANLIGHLKQRDHTFTDEPVTLSLEDMARSATPRDNTPLIVDWAELAQRASASLPNWEAIKAYEMELNLRTSIRSTYLHFLDKTGGDRRGAWRKTTASYRHLGPPHHLWMLIEEADQLEPLDAPTPAP